MSILDYLLKYLYLLMIYKTLDNLIIRCFTMYYIYKKKILFLEKNNIN